MLEYGYWIVGLILLIAAVLIFVGWRKGESIKAERLASIVRSEGPVYYKVVNYGGEDYYCLDLNKEMKDPAVLNLKQFEEAKGKVGVTLLAESD